ncbi:MAG: LysR family transcriptional regulator [Rhodobacteraceae bacterium]|nr:LysR family transcriptional regulator [Paracoccaceae bacterium]
MRQSQLRAFHYVALKGGFSRAAAALSLTQPAISEQVRKLEKDHDVLLFHRDRKRVSMTRAGERLFKLTERYFEVEDQIHDTLSETRAALGGKLRVIVDSANHITDLLGKFRTRYPGVTVSVKTANTEGVISALQAYEAEIGIAGSLMPGTEMQVLELGSTPIVAFAAVDFLPAEQTALTMEELAQMVLVLREKGSKTRAKLESEAAKLGLKLRPAIEAEGREAIRELVASGAGIGFVSKAEFGNDRRIREIAISGVKVAMNESLIHLKQRKDVRVIRSFMQVARAHVGK